LGPKWQTPLAKEWLKLPIDKEGHDVELLPPPLAIAALLFHPKNWDGMHRKAAEVRDGNGDRVYDHPFSCTEAVRCQAEVDGKAEEEGVTHLLAGLNLGDDKTDVERMASAHAVHLKLLNTAWANWRERQSKILLAILPKYLKDPDAAQLDNSKAKQRLYQRALALLLVLMEVCARLGIKMTHRSLTLVGDIPDICQAYASWRMTRPMPTTGPPLHSQVAYARHMPGMAYGSSQ